MQKEILKRELKAAAVATMVSSQSSFHTTPAHLKVILNKEAKSSCFSHHDGEQPHHSCT
jgi:hypothetical protein